MFRSALLVVLLYLVVLLRGQIKFGCSKDACKTVTCQDDLECGGGRVVKNASICGCCDLCVKSQEKGEACEAMAEVKIPRVECGPGLQCPKEGTNKVCKTGTSPCTKALNELNVQTDGQEMTTGLPTPKCDQFGFYEPVQCKSGMMCYCVDRNGDRLFGTAAYNEETKIDCKCSRDHKELTDAGLLSGHEIKFLRCESNGNYQEPQCTHEDCYCVKDGERTSMPITNKNWTIEHLPCHSKKSHTDSFLTPCIVERDRILETIRNASEIGITIVGLEPPSCDLDGTYSPKQCQKNTCYCVNKQGLRYRRTNSQPYELKRYSPDAEDMQCRCLREKEIFKTMLNDRKVDIFASYKCNINGNYLRMQCTTNVCYCVNENGFQDKDKAVTVANIKDLECYKPEYEDILGI